MTQTSYERKQEAAIAAIFVKVRYFVKTTKTVIYDVTSGASEYRVCLNANGTATCTCEGKAKYHKCCKHIKAMWRKEDARPQVKEPATALASRVGMVSQQEAIEVFRPLSDEIDQAYEVRGAQMAAKKVSRSCENCGGNHATSTCWL